MGKETHIQLACSLHSPFSPGPLADPDLAFAARGMAVFGPFLASYRSRVLHVMATVQRALAPLEALLDSLKCGTAKMVAMPKRPAFMALTAAVLKWPDTGQARCYVEGFAITGQIEPSLLFKPIAASSPQSQASFYGAPAVTQLHELLSRGPPRFAEEIFAETCKEKDKGFSGPFLTADEMNKKWGQGQWHFLERFAHYQPCGKLRCIDNAKSPATTNGRTWQRRSSLLPVI